MGEDDLGVKIRNILQRAPVLPRAPLGAWCSQPGALHVGAEVPVCTFLLKQIYLLTAVSVPWVTVLCAN